MKKMLNVLGIVLVLVVFGSVSPAEASGQRGRDHDSDDRRRSHVESVRYPKDYHSPVHYMRRLPAGYHRLTAGRVVYYHRNGVFLRSTPFGYQVVRAPFGMAFRSLPSGASRVRLGRNTYFVRNPTGYVLVPSPRSAFL